MSALSRKSFAAILAVGMIVSSTASAWIPPLPTIVNEIFDGRKVRNATEVVVRHTVELQPGQAMDVEERMAVIRNRRYAIWKVGAVLVAGTFDKDKYLVAGDKAFTTRSALWPKYLTYVNGDDFLSALVAEGFARRDQLQQFKPGFKAEGEPKTWNVKEQLLKHDDIFLTRLTRGVSIIVIGTQEGENRKAVFFDPGFRGVRRIEWKEGPQVVAWEFDGFHNGGKDMGLLPRQFFFEVEGVEKIHSELVAARSLTDKQIKDYQTAHRAASTAGMPENVESVLQLLLSYR